MDNLPEDFLRLLSSSSLPEKRAMLVALYDDIRICESSTMKDTDKLSEYVTYTPSFLSDKSLLEGIEAELDTLNISAKSTRKVTTVWLNSTPDSYFYSGKEHGAQPISNFNHIYNLLQQINDSTHVTDSKLNSCLVTCYSTAKKSLSLHSDDEKTICQQSPICNVSIGATRTIEFIQKDCPSTVEPVISHDLENLSLSVMKPGCQLVL